MDKKYINKSKRYDSIARWIITVGGISIIISVIAILLLIIKVTLPLFAPPKALDKYSYDIPAEYNCEDPVAVGLDDYLETGYLLDRSGTLAVFDVRSKKKLNDYRLNEDDSSKKVKSVELGPDNIINILWDDGSFSAVQMTFFSEFDSEQVRTINNKLKVIAEIKAGGEEAVKALTKMSLEKSLTTVKLLTHNRIQVIQEVVEEDIFGEVTKETVVAEIKDDISGNILDFTFDREGKRLYAGLDNGVLMRWDISEPGEPVLKEVIPAFRNQRPITSVEMVLGGASLAVGDIEGNLSTWFPVRTREDQNTWKTRLIHELEPHEDSVTDVISSLRNKTLISLDAGGVLNLDHMTSERHLLSMELDNPITLYNLNQRANGLVCVDDQKKLHIFEIINPHPEVSLKTLFGKVWYEGYEDTEFSWQSTAGEDDYESKFSLTPLIFGSIKGTLYAMIFAVPLALFGAAYTSQFTSGEYKRIVKPTVEIMAAIPSVVIGFLIALWLAPIIEKGIVTLFASIIVIPIVFVIFLVAWQYIRRIEFIKRVEKGREFIIFVPVLLLAGLISYWIGPYLEVLLFKGNFQQWLFDEQGQRYDQRNCIIIAFGLGFAVIPIIFSIAEDALSSVPYSLTAASLALGASRWQTVWRVILPSASPGIFAGIMIGFGRAVGETMIVLMATGNTPIMDWSVFNGMRTLSANIAVEIPEAPVDGTLYRILFLCAVVLFVITFILNTLAEVVRQRLSKKYARY